MPLKVVRGDPLLTQAQYLCISHNASGRTEMGALHTRMMSVYPVAFAAYTRQCKQGRINPGEFWVWNETLPRLMFWVVHESAVSATRLRYVQSISMALARDYRLEGMKSLALTPLGQPHEWGEIHKILEQWFSRLPLPVIVYEQMEAGVRVDEGL